MRAALYMCALAVTCRNRVLWACYLRLRAAGEKPKIAFTACMRKLLIMLNTMVRHQTTCNPEFGGVPLNLPYPFPVAVSVVVVR
jgi:transposase